MKHNKQRSKYTQDAVTRCARGMANNPKNRTKAKAQPRLKGYKKRKK